MPGRRERKKQATRRALRLAALELAVQRGLDKLTVEDISEAADVAPRTFFNYFTCKEDALVGESPEAVDELRDAIEGRPADEAPLETLRAVITDIGAAHTTHEHQEEARLRQRLVADNPALLPRQLARYAALERVIAEEMGKRTGTDPDRDLRPVLLAAVATTVIRVALQRWTDAPDSELAELIDEAFDQLAHGL